MSRLREAVRLACLAAAALIGVSASVLAQPTRAPIDTPGAQKPQLLLDDLDDLDVVAIRAALERFRRAELMADPDSIRAITWEDAMLQPPDGRRIEGHAAIVAFLAPRTRQNGAGATPRPVSPSPAPASAAPAEPARDTTPPSSPSGLVISPTGDMAVQWFPSQRMFRRGMFYYNVMNIWERRHGEWKLLVNAWYGRSAPATAPSADTTGRPQ